MSQAEKAELYGELKDAGIEFDRHYREYSTDELKAAVAKLREIRGQAAPGPSLVDKVAAAAGRMPEHPPASPASRDTMAGVRQNTRPEDEPIRVDPDGKIWYQDEVRKPGFPQPRGRRVLKYNDPGVKKVTVSNGEYQETFEMPGDKSVPSEVRITLPSYQVGIYKDPRLPFRIHTYDSRRGFDLFEVQNYYGGGDLVPAGVKRVYIENVLCYDIPTTIRAIQAEARERGLLKGI